MASLEKHFLFSLNILTFFVYGTSLSAFGISLQEYQRNIHMNIRELSFGVSLSAVFGCVSCLMGNYDLCELHTDLIKLFIKFKCLIWRSSIIVS